MVANRYPKMKEAQLNKQQKKVLAAMREVEARCMAKIKARMYELAEDPELEIEDMENNKKCLTLNTSKE